MTEGDVDVKSDRQDLLHVQMGYKDENNVSKSYFDRRLTQLGEVKCGLFRTGDYRITSPWFRLDKGNVYKNFVIKLQIQHQANTSYEPYYKKKISFNIGEPLRSLPNGVCDEIRNSNGQWELVRRVGKVILNGSEVGWANWSVADGGGYYLYVDGINGSKRLNIKVCRPICDTLKVVPSIYATRNKGIAITTGSYISVGFEENIVPPENLSAMKRWFADNPTTVIFELREPVITPIEPIEFEIKPLAIMIINSDISTTSNHKVILNRAGQIEQGILKIAELRKRVDELETVYENQLIGTQLKLSLLTLDHELEKEEI